MNTVPCPVCGWGRKEVRDMEAVAHYLMHLALSLEPKEPAAYRPLDVRG